MSYNLIPCKECGAQLLDKYPSELARGHFSHPDVPMDAYEAMNLLEVLKFAPGTGDWHGQLTSRAQAILERDKPKYGPNATAEQMLARIIND